MKFALCCETDHLILRNGMRTFFCPVCHDIVEEEE